MKDTNSKISTCKRPKNDGKVTSAKVTVNKVSDNRWQIGGGGSSNSTESF